MYMFNPDRAGERVRDALVAAAQARRRGQAADRRLRLGGAARLLHGAWTRRAASHCVFNPSYGRRYLLRNHQKLVVVDEAIGADRRRQHRRPTYLERRGPRALARPVASARRPRGGAPGALFRHLVPLVAAQAIRRLVTCAGRSPNIASGGGRCSGSSADRLSMRNSWWRSIGHDIRRGQRLDMIFAYFAPPGAMLRRIGRLGTARTGADRHRGQIRQ